MPKETNSETMNEQAVNDIISDLKEHYINKGDRVLIKKTIKTIERLKEENDDLFYKLQGVMLSVDKWLDDEELKQDEVNRAATMREKTLQITEKQQAEIKDLEVELGALQRFKARFDSLCGLDLEILGVTEDGDAKPYDEFYNNAISDMESAERHIAYIIKTAKIEAVEEFEKRLRQASHLFNCVLEFYEGIEKVKKDIFKSM